MGSGGEGHGGDSGPIMYKFSQAFGERGPDHPTEIQDVDLISAIRFNDTGDMIATGDRGGRVVILEKVESQAEDQNCGPTELRFWTQLQSHEPEFDYLKSMEIEEKINQIKWCSQSSGAHRLISTNDKTIKLWRIGERNTYENTDRTNTFSVGKNSSLRIPRVESTGREVVTHPLQVYSGGHAYHVNSISVCADDETFISADDLRVNLWHCDKSTMGFNVLDLKPDKMEDLVEVITCVEFHPKQCSLFVNSSSRGSVNLCDLRMNSVCEGYARVFETAEQQDESDEQSFFSEIVGSISDLKWSPCGRYLLTRDYMSLRLWDMHMESAPLGEFPIHENLRPRLCELYENDCVFDKFQCSFSADGSSALVGSYNGLVSSISLRTGESVSFEASVPYATGQSSRCGLGSEHLSESLLGDSPVEELIDPTKRITQVHSSPVDNTVSVASGPALYIYYV